ncbi:Lysophospholipase 2 [Venturia nashicola]|uniref:Lysophospholipase n=1 Tax=Venturia nashicola TaxID=86259 RepID=A0A4Z1P3V0_9PEZI|nr:Lysophospholipase 2 [Venturia nashicola]TLD36175.1 Lysophospholipase 2 [Venturia nashicola]
MTLFLIPQWTLIAFLLSTYADGAAISHDDPAFGYKFIAVFEQKPDYKMQRQIVLSGGYVPSSTSCPAGSLLRPAKGLSQSESEWISKRKPKADAALASWLKGINAEFTTTNLPLVGLAISGGGYRSALEGAGVIQAFDSRDSQLETSGLYQGLGYIAGLSGGALLLSSIVGNNYPTMSSLRDNLWKEAFNSSILMHGGRNASSVIPAITADILFKGAAGFQPTLTDPYGRLLAYQYINSGDGGVSTTLSSSITRKSNLAQFNAPYPIITALAIQLGGCRPTPNATQYEFTPHEFGSWDKNVNAFTPTKYLGTNLSNGLPREQGKCIQNYDNLSYIAGTSSSIFSLTLCPSSTSDTGTRDETLTGIIQPLLNNGHSHPNITRDVYGAYPNPFQNYAPATSISADKEIYLVDGGSGLQNNPIWPFIQPASRVQVLVVNDNSADTPDNYPNGTEILATYLRARELGLSRMPLIPAGSR